MNTLDKAMSGEWISFSEIKTFSENYQKEFSSKIGIMGSIIALGLTGLLVAYRMKQEKKRLSGINLAVIDYKFLLRTKVPNVKWAYVIPGKLGFGNTLVSDSNETEAVILSEVKKAGKIDKLIKIPSSMGKKITQTKILGLLGVIVTEEYAESIYEDYLGQRINFYSENYQKEFGYRGFNNKYEWLKHKISQANEAGDRETAIKYQYKLGEWNKQLRENPKKAKMLELGGAGAYATGSFIKGKVNKQIQKSKDKRDTMNQLRDDWDDQYN